MRAAASALLASALILAASARANDAAPEAAVPAKIVFVNVGQGDGVVMKIGGKIIVSDTGELNLEVMQDTLVALNAKRIDVLILTHPHQDHVGNAIDLLARWDVELTVLRRSRWWQGTDTNRSLTRALAAEPGMKLRYANTGDRFHWGGASWTFLNPPEGAYTGGSADAPKASLVYLLNVNGRTALFTGDIQQSQAKDVADLL